MRVQNMKHLKRFVACGLVGAAAGVSHAGQPFIINISGATLLRNMLTAPASTNDFCDVDGDGVFSPNLDQLAPAGTGLADPTQRWQVQYRGTGSVNGLIELINWGKVYATAAGDAEIVTGVASEGGFHNRTIYINNGLPTGPANPLNPGQAPRRGTLDGTHMVTTSTDPADSGILIHIAPLDVPLLWAVRVEDPVALDPCAKPGTPGYGNNPVVALNKDGTATTQTNKLPAIGVLNTNYANPDNCTAYDTAVVLAPVAPITNYGTGKQTITTTDLQWLSMTGRTKCGENFMFVTRDVGSGTRNAFQNSIGVEPSFGRGENIGPRTSSSSNDLLGPNFQPSNKGSNSRVEGTMQWHRLAIGYAGAERGVTGSAPGSWLLNGVFDCLGVIDDWRGGTMPARPSIENVLNNDANGFNIVGPSTLVTIGDPRAASAANCGDSNGNPEPENVHASAYVNNITRSIDAFSALPGTPDTEFSPGEFLASQFLLFSATQYAKDFACPQMLVDNNQNVPLAELTEVISVLANPVYDAFNTVSNGLVPTRTGSIVYTDGNAGAHYVTQNGSLLTYGSPLNTINKISGDFDGDGDRDCDDADEMVSAFTNRAGFRIAEPFSIEIVGDYTGDGNFLIDDLRYWADGLGLDGNGKLDRCDNFMKLDQAFGGNLFNTSVAGTGAYSSGASAGDVAGPSGLVTPGFVPIGADGFVDARDLDYVKNNFGDWCDKEQAPYIDLSCDMNGDLVIDRADLCKMVFSFLGTRFGDVNLDGVVNANDLAIATANSGLPGGWAEGDVNGDGAVDGIDLSIIGGGGYSCCRALVGFGDINSDRIVNTADLGLLISDFGQTVGVNPLVQRSDFNCDGVVNTADLGILIANFGNTY